MAHTHGHFGWVDLSTPDTTAATKFYGAVFGWDAVPVEMGYLFFEKDGKKVAGLGELSEAEQQQGVPPTWSSYVLVDDVDHIATKAAELGGNVVVPPMDIMDAGRMTYLFDPTGAAIGFWQPGTHAGADAFNAPGFQTWNELATREVAAASDFYGGLLPWKLDEQDMGGGFLYTQILLNDQPNGGIYGLGPDVPAGVPAHWTVYFATDDTDAAVATAIERGGSVTMPATDTPFGRVAGVADSQGAQFRVITLAAQD